MPAVRGVLLDIDGVLVTSWRPIPGATGAVAALREAGLDLRFLTNTTSRSAAEIRTALADADIDVGDDELLTAGRATAAHLRANHPGARCLVLNDGSDDDLVVAGVRVVRDRPADVVVLGSGGPSFSWEAMNRALRLLLDGAPLVAMHGSRYWKTADGPSLDGGAYAHLLEFAAGVDAVTIGKPAPAMFEAALSSLGLEASEVVMVGDDLRGDVLAAQAVGVRGLLVRTGKFRQAEVDHLDRPVPVVDSIADAPSWIAGRG